jgi:hypothetical protein
MGNLRHECLADGCYLNTMWDWSPYNDCFGDSGIRISDIDGIVERNNHFLLLDGKRVGRRGQRDMPDGQRKLYRRVARSGWTVMVFHGQPPTDVAYVRRWLPGGEFVQERPCDLADLHDLIAGWFMDVDRETVEATA